ncbi:class I adenylate-forming enzyme family protein [Sphingomonas sp. G-3-2-10]|uniref:class I adenylate-forming enzyme family protein n=1 Tax=Sphingomonas sp. G-3-2-10 TaxID=2728838 RepID=UPI00146D1D60|nr:class I adenylate-forming enzyme family protein [Sphingomonas sp. G-3-2-10]NML08423.1 acyl--CoA ligase [Sphingomonas sp. G-3-2-10]
MQSPFGNYGYTVLTANALRTPDAIALAYRGEAYSFDQLNRAVNQVAHALIGRGVTAGKRTGSLMSDAFPIAKLYLAEAKTGVVTAAFNPYWDETMTLSAIETGALDFVVYDAAHAALAHALEPRTPGVKWVAYEEIADAAATASEAEPPLGGFDEDIMAFFYTSGTSGVSKTVVHTHNSCKAISSVLLEIERSQDSVWGTGPIIWGIGFVATLGAALYVGMKAALEDDFGPARFLEAVQRERISHAAMIPSQWADLLSNHPHQDFDLSSLRMIILGGEPMSGTLLAKLRERLPQVSLYTFFGQTESPYTCVGRIEDEATAQTVGRARISVPLRTIDAAGNRVVGVPGEIAISGPHVFKEYLGRPEDTAKALKDGWFLCGDLGIIGEDGRLVVLGRREDAISRGDRFVRPIEIEEVVLTIPGVAEAGAIGTPANADRQKIILAVSLQSGAQLSEADIRQQLSGKLAAADTPELIVVADELPHGNDASGGRGKLLRRAIRDQYEHLI